MRREASRAAIVLWAALWAALVAAPAQSATQGAAQSAASGDTAGSTSTGGPSGTALIITGAAARIPQEAALIQALDERGLLRDLVFVSGASSGALNAVALNAIRSGRMSWDRYREILAGMRDQDVFARGARALPVDTAPLRALLERVVEGEMGYGSVGQLPIPTSISVTAFQDLGLRMTTYRVCGLRINPESDPSLSLVDLLMASTAFPVVFPPARIANAATMPDCEYVDGGAADDEVPYRALLDFERYRGRKVARVYIVSRKTDSAAQVSEELAALGINDHRVFDRLGVSMDRITSAAFARHLEALAREEPELAAACFVWKPEFDENFLLFNFDALDEQYAAAARWAELHDPTPLDLYLAERRRSRGASDPPR